MVLASAVKIIQLPLLLKGYSIRRRTGTEYNESINKKARNFLIPLFLPSDLPTSVTAIWFNLHGNHAYNVHCDTLIFRLPLGGRRSIPFHQSAEAGSHIGESHTQCPRSWAADCHQHFLF
jgi:hypothetical protein